MGHAFLLRLFEYLIDNFFYSYFIHYPKNTTFSLTNMGFKRMGMPIIAGVHKMSKTSQPFVYNQFALFNLLCLQE